MVSYHDSCVNFMSKPHVCFSLITVVRDSKEFEIAIKIAKTWQVPTLYTMSKYSVRVK